MNSGRYVYNVPRNVKFRKCSGERLPVSWLFTAASHRIDQWSMRVIQLIKTFDQTNIKQHDPTDDGEDQNLWEAWISFCRKRGSIF
jgi:hypothetical protein